MIGLLAVGEIATALAERSDPQLAYALESIGLAGIHRSGWFIVVLLLATLNLVATLIQKFPLAVRLATQRVPLPVSMQHVKHAKKSMDKYLYAEWASGVGREDFRDVVREWAPRRIGRIHVLRDEGGLNELQITAQKGRRSKLVLHIAHGATLLLGGALVWSAWKGFEGRIRLDEGSRSPHVEILSGNPPPDWVSFEDKGVELGSFYVPSFEVELSRFAVRFHEGPEGVTRHTRTISGELRFHVDGKVEATRRISVGKPSYFSGLWFFQLGWSDSGRRSARLAAFDREGDGSEISLGALRPGQEKKLGEEAVVKVTDVIEDPDDQGTRVSLEYREKPASPPESFWVFQDRPGFDSAHRRKSRFTFAVNGTRPIYTSEIAVVRNPAAPVFWLAVVLGLVALLIWALSPFERIWVIWNPGRIAMVGWSTSLFLFEPQFRRAIDTFNVRLGAVDPSVRKAQVEIHYGG